MKVKINASKEIYNNFGETPRDIVQAYRSAMFEQREQLDTPIPYRMEARIFSCIRNGEPEELKTLFNEMIFGENVVGCLSKDPLRQSQYLFVAGVTLATRSAIEGGLSEIEAYNLSDVYVQKADVCKRPDDVMALFLSAIYDFAKKVQQARIRRRPYSYPVALCIEYILNHLHYQITLNDLAKRCNLTTQYLSSLFKKETGTTLTKYILKEKLETAKQMLTYSELSLAEISQCLAFCSHSNFTEHFRRSYGLTPKQYRDRTRTYHNNESTNNA